MGLLRSRRIPACRLLAAVQRECQLTVIHQTVDLVQGDSVAAVG